MYLQRVGKVTIAELRRRGMSGEELRRLMWGRVSISTPTKAPLGVPASVPPLSPHVNNPNQLTIPPGPKFTPVGKAGLDLRPGLPVPSQVMGVPGHAGVGMIPGVPAGVIPGGTGVGMIQGTGGTMLGVQRTPVAQGIGMMPGVQAGGMMQGTGMMQGVGMVPRVQAGGMMQGVPGARMMAGAGGIPGVQVTGMTQGVQGMMPGAYGVGMTQGVQGMMPGAYGIGMTQGVQRIPGAQVIINGVQRSGGTHGVQGVGMIQGVPSVGIPGAQSVGMMPGVVVPPGVGTPGVQPAGMAPVVGTVSGLFGVGAAAPAADSAWRRQRQENSDSDPISGRSAQCRVYSAWGPPRPPPTPPGDASGRRTATAAQSRVGTVWGLFGVGAAAPAADSTWRRQQQENSDSDPISGRSAQCRVYSAWGPPRPPPTRPGDASGRRTATATQSRVGLHSVGSIRRGGRRARRRLGLATPAAGEQRQRPNLG
ncbi:Zinc finger protein 36 family 3 protein [Operophtera brumata]|uniref:Zinc finger protein 36 family 3 protein n=1 Tax=Operophtera brumata TaxID=104452 RepID=A0A0L7LQR1_OPEBR|nr:Zinc finger protein 36 family 3 protein [Operophtera brumata]